MSQASKFINPEIFLKGDLALRSDSPLGARYHNFCGLQPGGWPAPVCDRLRRALSPGRPGPLVCDLGLAAAVHSAPTPDIGCDTVPPNH